MTSALPPAPPDTDPPPFGTFPVDAPPPPPARPQLRRSRTDKMAGGVCGGLAEYSGIDPLLWRVGFVALTFAGGTGVLVYLLLWLLVPAGRGDGTAATTGSTAAARRRPAGPRSPVPGITLAALLIVVGVLVLIGRLTDWDVGVRGFLGATVLVVGLGLVAVAFTGGRRARGGLITLGVVLSVALLLASTGSWHFGGGVGDRTYRPATAAGVRPLYHGGVGDLDLDLTRVPLAGLSGPLTTRIESGVGDVEVLVPRSADVVVRVDQGLGDVDVFGSADGADGELVPGVGSDAWTGDGRAEFIITINSGVGDVAVSRA
jgi:phage shock protein PspC (stress-responsive transcriptional regulator)